MMMMMMMLGRIRRSSKGYQISYSRIFSTNKIKIIISILFYEFTVTVSIIAFNRINRTFSNFDIYKKDSNNKKILWNFFKYDNVDTVENESS